MTEKSKYSSLTSPNPEEEVKFILLNLKVKDKREWLDQRQANHDQTLAERKRRETLLKWWAIGGPIVLCGWVYVLYAYILPRMPDKMASSGGAMASVVVSSNIAIFAAVLVPLIALISAREALKSLADALKETTKEAADGGGGGSAAIA